MLDNHCSDSNTSCTKTDWGSITIIEQYSCGKSTAIPNEDLIVATPDFIAAIDGATAKTNFRLDDGETPGHAAARIIGHAIETLDKDITAYDAVKIINRALDVYYQSCCQIADYSKVSLKPDARLSLIELANRPTASAVIFSIARHEIWQIGDCPFWANGKEYRNEKMIDHLLASWRAEIIERALNNGASIDDIQVRDPGRDAIQPLITKQVRFQNKYKFNLGFGVLDGQETPEKFINIYKPQCREIVLATDGYPLLFPTLALTELHLQLLLTQDPLCIKALQGTKGIKHGYLSFDDRSYIRISI